MALSAARIQSESPSAKKLKSRTRHSSHCYVGHATSISEAHSPRSPRQPFWGRRQRRSHSAARRAQSARNAPATRCRPAPRLRIQKQPLPRSRGAARSQPNLLCQSPPKRIGTGRRRQGTPAPTHPRLLIREAARRPTRPVPMEEPTSRSRRRSRSRSRSPRGQSVQRGRSSRRPPRRSSRRSPSPSRSPSQERTPSSRISPTASPPPRSAHTPPAPAPDQAAQLQRLQLCISALEQSVTVVVQQQQQQQQQIASLVQQQQQPQPQSDLERAMQRGRQHRITSVATDIDVARGLSTIYGIRAQDVASANSLSEAGAAIGQRLGAAQDHSIGLFGGAHAHAEGGQGGSVQMNFGCPHCQYNGPGHVGGACPGNGSGPCQGRTIWTTRHLTAVPAAG